MSAPARVTVLGAASAPPGVAARLGALNVLGMRGTPVLRGFLIPAELISATAHEGTVLAEAEEGGAVSGLAAAILRPTVYLRAVARQASERLPPFSSVRTSYADLGGRNQLVESLRALATDDQTDVIIADADALMGTRGVALRRRGADHDEVVPFAGRVPAGVPRSWVHDDRWVIPKAGPSPRRGWLRRSTIPWLRAVRSLLDDADLLVQEGYFDASCDTWIEWCSGRRRGTLVDVCGVSPHLSGTWLSDVQP